MNHRILHWGTSSQLLRNRRYHWLLFTLSFSWKLHFNPWTTALTTLILHFCIFGCSVRGPTMHFLHLWWFMDYHHSHLWYQSQSSMKQKFCTSSILRAGLQNNYFLSFTRWALDLDTHVFRLVHSHINWILHDPWHPIVHSLYSVALLFRLSLYFGLPYSDYPKLAVRYLRLLNCWKDKKFNVMPNVNAPWVLQQIALPSI